MKEIEFRPVSSCVEKNIPPPKPAAKYIPEWFKTIPRFDGESLHISEERMANATMKMCQPFMDTLTSGYIQETWCDIHIGFNEESREISIDFDSECKVLDNRTKTYLSVSEDFYPIEFAWAQPWIPALPNGYSMLYTHPLNRHDLGFYSLSGIVDSDKYRVETEANYPMIIKKSFSGTIPKGTPMFQMIPLKRDSWKHKIMPLDKIEQINALKIRQFFIQGYKKLYWQNKKYQ